jgi:hypothetical protein
MSLASVSSLVSAVTLSGSPSSLEFNINPGEEGCLYLNIYSSDYSGELYSVMRWAEKGVEVNHPRDFTMNNSEIIVEGLYVDYSPEDIENFDGEEEIEVCVRGDELGVYRGSLEYRAVSGGNIGVGVGIWLKVNVTEEPVEEPPANPNSGGGSGASGGGSSGGGGGGSVGINNNLSVDVNVNVNMNNSDSPRGYLEKDNESEKNGILSENKKSRITGAVIGGVGDWRIIVSFLVILVIAAMIVYRRKR